MTKTTIKKLVRRHVWLAEEDLIALQLMADKGARPLSREIRQAIEEYVAKNLKEAA
jgi:hypothetical protein